MEHQRKALFSLGKTLATGKDEVARMWRFTKSKDASQFWNKTERTASTRLKKMIENGLIFEVGN